MTKSILLVDDDREMVDSFSRWFDKKGYQTKPTYHPMQSLIMAADHKYDVAVVDIGLPDMNGLELLDELIQLKMFPVIVLSGETRPKVEEKARELGAFDYLVKPQTMEDLQVVIDKALEQASE